LEFALFALEPQGGKKMSGTDRRRFLQLLGSGAIAAALPESIGRALAVPAHYRTGTIADVEHIVVLMQENRSFDHYFGTMKGVRGFGDPRAVTLPSGKPVWYQPDGASYVLPYRPDVPSVGLAFLPDPPHGWNDSHDAWNAGVYDRWVPSKGQVAMTYLLRKDLPYHFALADAFTVCDAYYCSLLGPTDPNRYHLWTGWTGNDGKNGGPVITNAEAGYDWHTYPERLQQAGISWKIYQDVGVGLDAAGFWGFTEDAHIGNFGDNSLLYFHQYQNALPGTPLADLAKTGTNIAIQGTLFDTLRNDVQSARLPQVTYIVAPEAFSEHPNWPGNYGAWYISQCLDALTSNPEVWGKTALFVTYDENGGFFDHMVPPTPPQTRAQGLSTVDTVNEIFPGDADHLAGPYGLGIRVPMLVVSPWSKGGWVNSEVFDHTSIIRFIEARFAAGRPELLEPNITPWRRAVAGDLTSAFNFARPNDALASLPSTAAFVPPNHLRHPDDNPTPPANQTLPAQEPGLRRARALPYALQAKLTQDQSAWSVRIDFGNAGKAAAVLHVRSNNAATPPRSYTVEPGKSLSDSWPAAADGTYDVSVFGPNGFMRSFKGGFGRDRANLDVVADYDKDRDLRLTITNHGSRVGEVVVRDQYTGEDFERRLAPRDGVSKRFELETHFGWYDVVITSEHDQAFEVVLAGHVENGRDSVSDPALGGVALKHES
jgi:phospholipase C